VKLVDANVLLYSVNEDEPHHARAKGWLDRALGGAEAVGLAWLPMLAFLRLSTNPRVFPEPLSVDTAAGLLEVWLSAPAALVVHPTTRHAAVLAGLLAGSGTAGNLVNDAHLAALSIEHSATVMSFDRDFGKFTGIRWEEPSA